MSAPGKRGRSLAAALGKAMPAEPAPIEAVPEAAPAAPERRRQVQISLYVSAEDHERLRDLSFHSKTSLQQLGVEAWNLLLEKRGHAPLAPTTAAKPSGRLRG